MPDLRLTCPECGSTSLHIVRTKTFAVLEPRRLTVTVAESSGSSLTLPERDLLNINPAGDDHPAMTLDLHCRDCSQDDAPPFTLGMIQSDEGIHMTWHGGDAPTFD